MHLIILAIQVHFPLGATDLPLAHIKFCPLPILSSPGRQAEHENQQVPSLFLGRLWKWFQQLHDTMASPEGKDLGPQVGMADRIRCWSHSSLILWSP